MPRSPSKWGCDFRYKLDTKKVLRTEDDYAVFSLLNQWGNWSRGKSIDGKSLLFKHNISSRQFTLNSQIQAVVKEKACKLPSSEFMGCRFYRFKQTDGRRRYFYPKRFVIKGINDSYYAFRETLADSIKNEEDESVSPNSSAGSSDMPNQNVNSTNIPVTQSADGVLVIVDLRQNIKIGLSRDVAIEFIQRFGCRFVGGTTKAMKAACSNSVIRGEKWLKYFREKVSSTETRKFFLKLVKMETKHAECRESQGLNGIYSLTRKEGHTLYSIYGVNDLMINHIFRKNLSNNICVQFNTNCIISGFFQSPDNNYIPSVLEVELSSRADCQPGL
jgi:hypothetical protein